MTRDQSDCGFVAVKTTDAVAAGRYYGLLVGNVPCVIAAITFEADYLGDQGIVGMTLPAGMYRPMRFTTLTLTSGEGFCERGA